MSVLLKIKWSHSYGMIEIKQTKILEFRFDSCFFLNMKIKDKNTWSLWKVCFGAMFHFSAGKQMPNSESNRRSGSFNTIFRSYFWNESYISIPTQVSFNQSVIKSCNIITIMLVECSLEDKINYWYIIALSFINII